MKQYFFLLIDRDGSECDFRVGEFPNREKAFQLADVIASELRLDPDYRLAGVTLEVRDMHGRRLLAKSIPVSELPPPT